MEKFLYETLFWKSQHLYAFVSDGDFIHADSLLPLNVNLLGLIMIGVI